VFADNYEAKAFLRASQTEGFRFYGAEIVDPEHNLAMIRYFILGDSGQLIQCGEDWGPMDTVWEVEK